MDLLISLIKSEIEYDINTVTHLIGNRETADGKSVEQAHNYGSTDGKDEKKIIDRFMEDAVNDLIGSVANYMSNDMPFSDNDLEVADVDSFDFPLEMPETFNKTYIRPIRSAMHKYIVNQTLFYWFTKTKPDEAALYEALNGPLLEDIKSYLNRRTKMLKIRPFPHI